MITYLKKLTDERDSLTSAATDLTEKAAKDERDLTDTEKSSLTAWATRCAEIDSQLTEYSAQADSQRAYARLRESLNHNDEPEPVKNGNGSKPAALEVRDWGEAFIESTEFRAYNGLGSSGRVQVPWETRAEIKIADLPGVLRPNYLFTPPQHRQSTPLLDAIGQVVVSQNVVEWVKFAPIPVPDAVVVAEGVAKPEAAFTATTVTDTLETYAHWKAITRQALEDIPQIRSVVEGRLRQGLVNALNTATVAALNAIVFAAPNPVIVNADQLTGIRLALAQVQNNGYGSAASVVLNPADLAALDISLMGSTMSGPVLNNSAFGLNFIPTVGVAAGTAYVGDFDSAITMFRRSSAAIYATDSHSDFWVKNLIAILAEIRATVAATESTAIAKTTKV